MKRLVWLLAAVFLLWGAAETTYSGSGAGLVFQISPLEALMRGDYDGPTTFGELKQKGDFGLGTLNGLDGEMVALDGRFYQVRFDGKVIEVEDSEKTPFAVVTFFKATKKSPISRKLEKKTLEVAIDRLLDSKEHFTAVRVGGDFRYIKVRSVPRQNKPYVPLMDVLQRQAVFELKDVKGTLVGFRFPAYAKGVNVPGYHFHFLTEDRTAGGHVLACTVENCTVEIAESCDLFLRVPSRKDSVTSAGGSVNKTETSQ